jgi:hypothetical protein
VAEKEDVARLRAELARCRELLDADDGTAELLGTRSPAWLLAGTDPGTVPAADVAWRDLEVWVGRTVANYGLQMWVPCWRLHWWLVQELVALREDHRVAVSSSGRELVVWHGCLWQFHPRLEALYTRCAGGRHHRPDIEGDLDEVLGQARQGSEARS